MKRILNLYAGVGGNRKLWLDVDVTAVEINPSIAAIYQELFPDDTVLVEDAHKYLLKNYDDGWDFIWSSPPCKTHSRLNYLHKIGKRGIKYPNMSLYQEIILLDTFYEGVYCIENVKGYYPPLIRPQEIGRHYYWANFRIPTFIICKKVRNDKGETLDKKMKDRGIIIKNFHGYEGDKRVLLNNCIEPELGKFILDAAFKYKQQKIIDTPGNMPRSQMRGEDLVERGLGIGIGGSESTKS